MEPPIEQDELVRVELGPDVFAATRDDLPDLRIADSEGAEVAYVIRQATVAQDQIERRTWTVSRPSVTLGDDGGLQVEFTLEDGDPVPTGIRLISPLRDFERRIQVFSSHDGETWTPRTENGLVYDYSRFLDARGDSLRLAMVDDGAAQRKFRIVVEAATQEQQSQLVEMTRKFRGDKEAERTESVTVRRTPYRIDRIELWSEEARRSVQGPRIVEYPVELQLEARDDAKQVSVATVTTSRQPITSLRLLIADRNFSRDASVEFERDRSGLVEWTSIGSGTLSRIDFRHIQHEHLQIEFTEVRANSLRVVIKNGDSPPLQITDAVARGPAYEVIFLAHPGEEYRIAYGSPVVEAPRYDTAAIATLLASNVKPVAAKLAPPAKLAGSPEPQMPRLRQLLENKVVLTGTIALLVTVLAAGLFRAAKRIDQLPPE